MSFQIIPKKEVMTYLKERVSKSEDSERAENAKNILKYSKNGIWKVLFAFKNEYGESYLCIQDLDGKVVWAGDESDWGGAYSYRENSFIDEVLSSGKY